MNEALSALQVLMLMRQKIFGGDLYQKYRPWGMFWDFYQKYLPWDCFETSIKNTFCVIVLIFETSKIPSEPCMFHVCIWALYVLNLISLKHTFSGRCFETSIKNTFRDVGAVLSLVSLKRTFGGRCLEPLADLEDTAVLGVDDFQRLLLVLFHQLAQLVQREAEAPVPRHGCRHQLHPLTHTTLQHTKRSTH